MTLRPWDPSETRETPAEERRGRLEDQLSDVQLRALYDACADLGIEAASWTEIDTLRRWVETLAVARRVRWLVASRDISETAATREAAAHLGLNAGSVRKNLVRWRRADRERRQRERREAA